MSASLDEIGIKVAALKLQQDEVIDHWKGETDALTRDITGYYEAHKAEANKASELLNVLIPKKNVKQMTPAEMVLAGRGKIAKAKAWLRKNWRTVLYVGIALVILYDVIS